MYNVYNVTEHRSEMRSFRIWQRIKERLVKHTDKEKVEAEAPVARVAARAAPWSALVVCTWSALVVCTWSGSCTACLHKSAQDLHDQAWPTLLHELHKPCGKYPQVSNLTLS